MPGNCEYEDEHGSCDSPKEGRTDFCASHNRLMRKAEKDAMKPKKVYQLPKPTKPIAKVSGKMAKAISEYSREKDKWIKGKQCAVRSENKATQIHHKMGRIGYADDWARQHDITLLMDKRYWLPVSMDGHLKIELSPKWAKEMGFSVDRLASENKY